MPSPSSPGPSHGLPFASASRVAVAMSLLGISALGIGCTRKQMQTLVDSVRNAEPEEAEEAPALPPVSKPVQAPPARATESASAIDVDPGSGRDVALAAGYRIMPPATFNVISEEEGSDFSSNYKHYRWERLSGGAWFIVTFLSGMQYEGDRRPKIQDERVVRRRIQSAFARVDKKHQLRSNGSQDETLAGLKTVRTNVIGQVEGEDAIGHLYLISDGKYLIEIVCLATEPNRSVLKVCRETANSLSRDAAK